MEPDGIYRNEASDERMTLFIIRRDGPVAMRELPDKWVGSLLKKNYISRHPGISSYVEITGEGGRYLDETM